MPTADIDLIELPERRRLPRRAVALVAGTAVLLAIAWGAVALRPEKVEQPTLPGWPAVGVKASDNKLRETAWQAWARRDPSVKLEATATLFADEWHAGQRTVVLLATSEPNVRLAVVLVNGDQAERYSTRSLPPDVRFVTEVVEANGQTAVLVVAPTMRSVVVTAATVGASRANEAETQATGGALLPVAAGQTATRVVLKDEHGGLVADRVPGADSSPQTPPAPLILSEEVLESGRHEQIRTDGSGVTCRITLADPASEAPALVQCPP